MHIQGHALMAGNAHGEVIFTDEPLSFWGGYNAREGKIIDTHHALCGATVAGKIFVLPGARGSSTGSGILLEAIRLGKAPAAMILKQRDAILALGAIVARELYAKTLPLVIVSDEDFRRLHKAKFARVSETGAIEWGERDFINGEDGQKHDYTGH
jgi:predicted aconitase with swiveling domain